MAVIVKTRDSSRAGLTSVDFGQTLHYTPEQGLHHGLFISHLKFLNGLHLKFSAGMCCCSPAMSNRNTLLGQKLCHCVNEWPSIERLTFILADRSLVQSY